MSGIINPTQALIDAWKTPATVGDIQAFIQHLDSSLPVFRFEVGDHEGRMSWKRKETWKQWVKRHGKKETKSERQSAAAPIRK